MPKNKSGYNSNGYRQMYVATAVICAATIIIIVLLTLMHNWINPVNTSVAPNPGISENELPSALPDNSVYIVSYDNGNDDILNYIETARNNSGIYAGSLVLVKPTSEKTPDISEMEKESIYPKMLRGIYGLSTTALTLDSPAIDALNSFIKGFYDATNNSKLVVTDAYTGFNELRSKDKLQSYADLASANSVRLSIMNAGTDKMGEGVYLWLNDHCYQYGFIIRYPESKESVTGVTGSVTLFRYVGVAHAVYMKNNDLCLEEYISKVKEHDYKNPIRVTYGDNVYKVYYKEASATGSTMVYVPSGYPYEISGDNESGFIITVTESAGASDTSRAVSEASGDSSGVPSTS